MYPKQLIKAIDGMNELFDDGEFSIHSNTVFAGVFKRKNFVPCGSTACFMSIQRSEMNGLNWLISHIQETDLSVSDQEVFLNYLFNDSPFNSVFVTKNASEAVESGWIVLSANHPSNLVVGGAVATRCISESPHVVVAFCDLLAGGVEPNLAFVLAHHFSGGISRDGNVHWESNYSCHRCLDPARMDSGNLSRFIAHTPMKLNQPLSENNSSYSGIDALWGEIKGKPLYKYIKAEFDYTKILAGGIKRVKIKELNPFKRKVEKKESNNPKAFPHEDSVRAMVIFSKQITEDFL